MYCTLFDSIFQEDQEATSPKNDIANGQSAAAAAAPAATPSEETVANDASTELRPTSANDIETTFTSLPAILPVTQTEKKVSRVKHLPIFQFVKKKSKKEKATKAAQKYNLAFVQPPSKESEEDSM